MTLKEVSKKIFTSRWFIFGVSAISLYSVLGFFLLPYLASHYAKKYSKNQLARELVLQELHFNPYTWTVEAKGFGIEDKNNPSLLTVGSFSADFEPFSSLFHGVWTFSEIKLSDSFLEFVLRPDGRTNLSELLENLLGNDGKQRQTESKPFPGIRIEKIGLQNGNINFVDRQASPPARVQFTSLVLDLEPLTTLPNQTGKYAVSGRTKAGERLEGRGTLSLNPLQSNGYLKMESVKTATVWQFFRDRINCARPMGEVTLAGGYVFETAGKQPRFALQDLDFDISDFSVGFRGESSPLLSIINAAGRKGKFEWDARSFSFKELSIGGGLVRAEMDQEGIANWRKLLGAGEKMSSAAAAAGGGSGDIEKGAFNATGPSTSWTTSVQSFDLKDFQVHFTDLTTEPSATLTLASVDLDLEGFSTDPNSTVDFKLSANIEEGGNIIAKGKTMPWNGTAEGHVEITNLSLLPLQPYFNRVTRLTMTSGTVHTAGDFKFDNTGTQDGSTYAYQGEGKILSFQARAFENDRPPWGWESMSCNEIRLSLSPVVLELGDVAVVGPSGKLVIYEDKTVNLSRLLIRKKENENTENRNAELRITVDRIQLERGSLEFADLSLNPKFGARIHELHGSVTGISSIPETQAKFELEGQVDKNGLAKIHAQADLFKPAGTTELSINFRNIEMTNLTPYAVRFAGYDIASGKLSLDLQYTIRNARMEGRNRIIADQLTLGRRVKSPSALDLPFELAIALLKDANGTIEIGLPVSGDLNKPQFDFGEIIGKALGNLLGKIVTAPFAWLAALVGHETQDFDSISFDPGKATLLPPEREKLSDLAKALAKRPKLGLEIQGGYDPKTDIPALKSLLMRQKLAAKMHQDQNPVEDPGPPVFHDPETQSAVEMLFLEHYSSDLLSKLQSDFRETLQPDKSSLDKKEQAAVWAGFYEDLYGRLKEETEISENRLKNLAETRGVEVRRFLVDSDLVNPDRIEVLDPTRTKSRGSDQVVSKLSLDTSN
jgi:hypothetical protein